MDYASKLGMVPGNLHANIPDSEAYRYINFRLASLGLPYNEEADSDYIHLVENHIKNFQEKNRLLSDYLCPADRRIQNFIDSYLEDMDEIPTLPSNTFVLDQYGLARRLSLPVDENEYSNEYLTSHRIKQGILHNPLHDRRTTQGSFHIAEGGLPVPMDKKEVPRIAFKNLLNAALNPPEQALELPFLSNKKKKAKTFVSLLLRPTVSPEVPGVLKKKSLEVRFFVPGSLVSNLDFVESIFGNAGDPNISENDAGLDVDHWTGHSGCIILAPHLPKLTKKELGLPHVKDATERQLKDGMAWEKEDELYNDGIAFKLTARDERGVVVTLIGDNYFGYSKKEIKTQISYAANLYGLAEEEHAGGAIVFPSKSHGEHFYGRIKSHHFEEQKKLFGEMMELKPENYGVDKKYKNIIYLPEDAEMHLYKQEITWNHNGKNQKLKLLPDHHYLHPSGYKVRMEKHPAAPAWRLIGTSALGTFCHKPCTVSGGGKSEISKSLMNAIIYDSFYIEDVEEDFALADKIIQGDYSDRWIKNPREGQESRSLLSPERSLGSVIKLLTPSNLYTDAHNEFLKSIPIHVKALVLFIKRFYVPEWKENWRAHFSVNKINGREGHALFFNNRRIMASYLRVGYNTDESWFVHKLRTDFYAASKIQMEDDISASITVPKHWLKDMDLSDYSGQAVKFAQNCEFRFFQRPDEAVNRGYDKEAEADLSTNHNFISNYEPLTPENAKDMVDKVIEFDLFTDPIKEVIRAGAEGEEGSYFISPSHPRIVDGKPTKNPRYLQSRPDFSQPIDYYLAEVGARLYKRVPLEKPVLFAVDAVLPARRNNPTDKKAGFRPLSVYSPIHYQELPELFMDFICSLTGKSPSTTGAGSEGALTKGPFNMLNASTDLNNALLSYILTGYHGFSSAAGHIGITGRMDHDISILIPELWSKFNKDELEPKKLIADGSLEKLDDFEYEGEKILASRLGYRITETFCFKFFGRVFDEPQQVFSEALLRPESEDMESFVDGIKNIVEAQERVAKDYFADGSVESCIPPLQVLLHIMLHGQYEGKDLSDPELRKMFTADYVLSSDWYQERLKKKQEIDKSTIEKQISYIQTVISDSKNRELVERMQLKEKIEAARKDYERVCSSDYLEFLKGTIGADPLFKAVKG
jgi:hypothetical protein